MLLTINREVAVPVQRWGIFIVDLILSSSVWTCPAELHKKYAAGQQSPGNVLHFVQQSAAIGELYLDKAGVRCKHNYVHLLKTRLLVQHRSLHFISSLSSRERAFMF